MQASKTAVSPTSVDGGDSDAWRWRNENDAMNARDGANRRGSLEEKCVGTSVVSFEELLARELEKSQQAQGANTQETRTGNGARRSNVQKKPFLKKGDRGWWMQRPDVKAKMSKHVLVSKDIDGAESSSSKATTVAASASLRSSTQQSSVKKNFRLSLDRQQSQASDVSDRRRWMEPRQQQARLPSPPPLSPPIRRRQPMLERHPPSPPPPPPAPVRQSYSDYDHRQIIDSQPAARLSDSMRTTTSVDTLGMSRVRQSYEAQLEREADELADFEAIERELAAEKDSYLVEKQQYRHEQVKDDSFKQKPAPLWHFSSGSQSQQRSLHQETSFQSFDTGYGSDGGNLELNGYSLLLFDDDQQSSPHGEDQFEPTSQFSSDRRRISEHFATPRHPYAASELSAISLNDSESWDDHLSQQLYQPRAGSLSPISKRDSASRLLDVAQSDFGNGYGSFGNNATNSAHESNVRRASDALSEDLYGYNAAGGSHTDEFKTACGEPPVSALMQQFFAGNQGSSYAGAEDDEQYDTSHDSDYYQDEVDADQQSAARSQGKTRRDEVDEPDNSLSTLRSKMQTKPSNNVSSLGKTAASNQPASGRRAKSKFAPVPARNTAKSAPSKQQSNPPSSKTRTGPILPVMIEEKLFELEEEVKCYKAETLQLQKKKDFYDQAVKKLAKEREEFARFQNEQGMLIEKEWEKERLKMKREEKLMERQIKLKLSAAASHHDRKERGEIEALKAQIVKMQLDEKARAGKWKAMNDNLRQRVGELEDKNRELSEEVKFLEKDRLEQWGKYEALLKEKQRPSESATRLYNGSHAHFDLDAEREIRTMNDLFAIKDTAEELLKGWQDRDEDEDDAAVQSKSNTMEAFRDDASANASPFFSARQYQSSTSRPAYNDTGIGASGGDKEPVHRASPTDLASSASSRSTTASAKYGEDKDEPNADAAATLSSSRSAFESKEPKRIKEEIVQTGGKRELIYTDGSKKIFFADGNEKEIDSNGHTTIRFTNGDRKELFPDTGISIYYYYEAQTTLTTFPDKTKVYEFPNQQVEKSFPDGTTEISFADGIKKTIRPNGDEFSVFPDGTTMLEQKDGLREMTLLNQKKIRYYPDGKMAWITPQGKVTQVRSDAELKKLMESL